MTEHRQIEIDLEVHKRIELERRSFSEPDNTVLRRLLGIDKGASAATGQGRAWSGKGVSLPHGTLVQMEYNGRLHEGHIDSGSWLVEGLRFDSPSAAAGGVALTRAGTHPSLDGWNYWHVKRRGDSGWLPLSSLRQQAKSS